VKSVERQLYRLKSVELQLHPMYEDPAGGLCTDDSVTTDPPVTLCLWVRGYDKPGFESSDDEPVELLDVDFPYNPENKKALLDLMDQMRGCLEDVLGPDRVQVEVLGGHE